MIYFNNPFNLPGPKDLGMSDSNNAMPWRKFADVGDDKPDWDDYYAKLKELYPIKFFLTSTLPEWIKFTYLGLIGWKLRDAWWWVKYHTTHRYHWLDLRQPDYRYGYHDTSSRMLYAIFNLLSTLVEKKNYYLPTEADVAKNPYLAQQRADYLEAEALYHYWKVERPAQRQQEEQLLTQWSDRRLENPKSEAAKAIFDQLNQLETTNLQQQDEAAIRLMKIRTRLW